MIRRERAIEEEEKGEEEKNIIAETNEDISVLSTILQLQKSHVLLINA